AWVRVQGEDRAADQRVGPLFNPADGGVAVFDRKRKIAGHERGTHAFVFALGHTSGKHEPLGTAADRAVKRPHAQFAGLRWWERFLSDFGLSRAAIPERLGNFVGSADPQLLYS